jgi:hypothetical protein
MVKIKIIAFYLIILIGLGLEIVFLFEIPYYRYSYYLQYLKIVRMLFGFIIFLIDIYLRFTSISEIIFDIKGNIPKNDDNYFKDKNVFYLIDKILIISGFVISLTSLVLNAIGTGLSSKYLDKPNYSSDLQNTYFTKSLLLLFENILITISWIYFTIYWLLGIFKLIKKQKNRNGEQQENAEGHNSPGSEGVNEIDAPLPPISSGREINEIR